jgi:hypothetical protein
MGLAKEMWLRDQERGWFEPDEKYACPDHVDDPYLRDLIMGAPDENTCDYCGRTSEEPIAASIAVLVESVAAVIDEYWEDAENFVPWDDGWQWDVSDTWEVTENFREYFDDSGVADDVLGCFRDRSLAEQSLMVLDAEQRLRFGWQRFVKVVTHETRYLFQTRSVPLTDTEYYESVDGVAPWDMLDRLGEVTVAAELLHALDANTGFYRGRTHECGVTLNAAADLGTAPYENALSNRMGPAGIPMFYGAMDAETARAEIAKQGKYVTTGLFLAAKPLVVVDFTKELTLPSLFDIPQRGTRDILRFVQGFVHDLQRSIAKDGREHVDYVPTQIVTEYFRRTFLDRNVDGLLYPSAKNDGGVCCVLFVERNQCVDIAPDWPARNDVLGLDPSTVVTQACDG